MIHLTSLVSLQHIYRNDPLILRDLTEEQSTMIGCLFYSSIQHLWGTRSLSFAQGFVDRDGPTAKKRRSRIVKVLYHG
jgi:hypothetical protein